MADALLAATDAHTSVMLVTAQHARCQPLSLATVAQKAGHWPAVGVTSTVIVSVARRCLAAGISVRGCAMGGRVGGAPWRALGCVPVARYATAATAPCLPVQPTGTACLTVHL